VSEGLLRQQTAAVRTHRLVGLVSTDSSCS